MEIGIILIPLCLIQRPWSKLQPACNHPAGLCRNLWNRQQKRSLRIQSHVMSRSHGNNPTISLAQPLWRHRQHSVPLNRIHQRLMNPPMIRRIRPYKPPNRILQYPITNVRRLLKNVQSQFIALNLAEPSWETKVWILKEAPENQSVLARAH
jgi:hypothetical protein